MEILRREGGTGGIPGVGRRRRGLDVPLPKSLALPRRIGEKNKKRCGRSDQMSLDWDSTIPVHALFLGYSCPFSTSDFASVPTVWSSHSHLGRLGRPPHTHAVDVGIFTLDSQSPS